MLLQRASSSSLIQICILCFVSIWPNVNTVEASVFCSRETYGIPKYSDCQHALLALPSEEVIHYFVEQQLRAGLSTKDWTSFDDPRRDPHKQKVVQVPKLWNAGGCNVALLSYVQDGRKVPISSTEWSKILATGLQTLMTCLLSHSQGGAGVVNSIRDFPALSIFLWQDGSQFDQTMNDYMSAPFPAGIDPGHPTILQSNLLSLENSTTAGLLLTGNVSIS